MNMFNNEVNNIKFSPAEYSCSWNEYFVSKPKYKPEGLVEIIYSFHLEFIKETNSFIEIKYCLKRTLLNSVREEEGNYITKRIKKKYDDNYYLDKFKKYLEFDLEIDNIICKRMIGFYNNKIYFTKKKYVPKYYELKETVENDAS